MLRRVAACRLQLLLGDITRQQVDGIVNAANSRLAGGGGVDGAIHRAGGPAIMQETAARYPQGCPTGEAVATGAGLLPAKFVFHTVGPVWAGGRNGEAELLAGCHRACLNLAIQHGCASIAFPAISTGVYGYPMDRAAETALRSVVDFLNDSPATLDVRFVLFSEGACGAFGRVLEDLLPM